MSTTVSDHANSFKSVQDVQSVDCLLLGEIQNIQMHGQTDRPTRTQVCVRGLRVHCASPGSAHRGFFVASTFSETSPPRRPHPRAPPPAAPAKITRFSTRRGRGSSVPGLEERAKGIHLGWILCTESALAFGVLEMLSLEFQRFWPSLII